MWRPDQKSHCNSRHNASRPPTNTSVVHTPFSTSHSQVEEFNVYPLLQVFSTQELPSQVSHPLQQLS